MLPSPSITRLKLRGTSGRANVSPCPLTRGDQANLSERGARSSVLPILSLLLCLIEFLFYLLLIVTGGN